MSSQGEGLGYFWDAAPPQTVSGCLQEGTRYCQRAEHSRQVSTPIPWRPGQGGHQRPERGAGSEEESICRSSSMTYGKREASGGAAGRAAEAEARVNAPPPN